MAKKRGKSEKKADWLGREYIQHYDSKGNKSGRSERKETWLGKKYTEHYDAKGEKGGRSEKKETWLGKQYTQKYDAEGERSGRSEKKETWLGKEYIQHYDSKGNETDWSDNKETWLGKRYRQRYSDDTDRATSEYSNSHNTSFHSGSSYGAFGAESSASDNPNPTSLALLIIGVMVIIGILLLVGTNLLSRDKDKITSLPEKTDLPGKTSLPEKASVNTVQSNLSNYYGVWEYYDRDAQNTNYLQITTAGMDRVRLTPGYEYPKGKIVWQDELGIQNADGIYLKSINGKLTGSFVSWNFRATHGNDFTYRITCDLTSSNTLTYTVGYSTFKENYVATKKN